MASEPNDCLQRKLKADFPHFPEEVLDIWLKPYLSVCGWPPHEDRTMLPQGRWKGILSVRPVSFWAKVHWRKEHGELHFRDLATNSQEAIVGIRDAHLFGKVNSYCEISDAKERLKRIMAFVAQNGVLPSPVILLRTARSLAVVDGHHRLVIYFMNKEPQFRQALHSGVAEFKSDQPMWVGYHEGDF